ncbi:DNA-binding protein [Pantoea alhagi]|uniref:DNA-binding protein n=1 Tax=Pantoea alhagi TaxID=1891675 RepID=A0A1W6B8E1_9GAMM|nr:PLP-dependent aminotransferase family protein [Pantoea alhagi]ARJ43350.1 DNA-binding protein [Pantoea alhagi]
MNIPDDAFYTLLENALAQRGGVTRQRALYHALRDAILAGKLQARSRLPGSRTIAQRLTLSRNTVNGALEQLALEGYLLRDRKGSQVATLAAQNTFSVNTNSVSLPAHLMQLPSGSQRDSPPLLFTPGTPALNYFPLPLWRRLLTRVLHEESCTLLGYGDAAGEWSLRVAIARHLALARGIHCDASQIIITEGALEGLSLCARLLTQPGESAWIEDPGYLGVKSAFTAAGLVPEAIPVDNEGLCFANFTALPPRIIFTSPSNQYPTGAVLSAARRLALLTFARQHHAWIVEDDYDSEFRYDNAPIPAMAGMQPDAPVIYLGTFSKTLFPALRTGFIVLPPALALAARPVVGALLRGGHRAEQRALARFIEEGHYARHLAAMRRLYRKRQQQLRAALANHLTEPFTITGGNGGLHLTITLNAIDDVMLARQARQYQLAPAPLSQFYLDKNRVRYGLVLGYGNTSASQFVPAIERLQQLITRLRHQASGK